MSESLWTHGPQHARLPLSTTISWTCSHSCPLSQWCHPTVSSPMPSSSAAPFSFCPQSFSASGSFPVSWLFSSGGQNRASASASVLPVNIQGWFPLGLTGLISLQSEGLSRVSSKFESINSLALSLLYGLTLTSVHDCWKHHSFDYMNLCQQSDVSVF